MIRPPMAAGDEHSGEHRAAHGEAGHECVEWCPICRTMDVLRASSTPEAREQWHEVQREAILTLRTLVERYAQREPDPPSDPPPTRPAEPVRATPVEEIPPVE